MNNTSIRLKQWFPLYKHCLAVVCSITFFLLDRWSSRHRVGYFQEWLSRREFLFSCICAVILIYCGVWIIGVLFTVGHVVGVPIAQQLGDYLYSKQQIDGISDAGQYMHQHEHAYIWWGTIILCVVIGIIVQIIICIARKRRKKLED